MSHQPGEPESEPIVVELHVDAIRLPRALQSGHSRLFFMTHPDLNGRGWGRPDEEPTT
ncbi:hypothetical protein BX257_1458 [Streptomyces sp. 3212.3]|uniref:hypothetical protein n=1 Tax=Streptomyces sp. 3212.3 TaxID=1938846 RepID=UPI000E387CFF|nr:hypothetical protein [Streptomyces sp. 3212.3]REE58970.1 hypothetical protein BX257_1458 [Streptomyces sp. 3212.3]